MRSDRLNHSAAIYASRILLSLYAVEGAAFVIFIGIYKAPAWDKSLVFTKAGVLLSAGAAVLMISVWIFAKQILWSGPLRRKALVFAVATNLFANLTICLALQAIVLAVSRGTSEGIVIGNVTVRPTWTELVAQSRREISRVNPLGSWEWSYLMYDRELGWIVGPNRQTTNGMYFSSIEGLRSGGPNVRMADNKRRFRVALIGDSNAFSLEVPFKQSWGYYLEHLLGKDVQVLNFGVDGYGIDQIYLRYKRDVRPWNPDVVVVGFNQHDFIRTMAVYPFISLGWPGFLVKPRFIIENERLRLLNVPLPSPEEVLGTSQIQNLPYIAWDFGYGSSDWYWRFDHGPLFLRFLASTFPRERIADPRVSIEAAKALNGKLLDELVKSIEQDHASVLLVDMTPDINKQPMATEVLNRVRAPVLDAAKCAAQVPANRRRAPSGHHYTGPANFVIAQCTAPAVDRALKKLEKSTAQSGSLQNTSLILN